MVAPNRVWAGDITYIHTDESWLFLAVVIDLFSRQVVGSSLREDMTRDIVIDAVRMPWFRLWGADSRDQVKRCPCPLGRKAPAARQNGSDIGPPIQGGMRPNFPDFGKCIGRGH